MLACLPDFGSLPMLSKGSSNGRLYAFARLCITTTLTRAAYRCVQHLRQEAGHAAGSFLALYAVYAVYAESSPDTRGPGPYTRRLGNFHTMMAV